MDIKSAITVLLHYAEEELNAMAGQDEYEDLCTAVGVVENYLDYVLTSDE